MAGATGMTVEVRVVRETAAGERRVAAVPETVKKLIAAGAAVQVESGAGAAAGFPDQAYRDAGAAVVDAGAPIGGGLVLCVQCPPATAIASWPAGTVLVGILHPQADADRAAAPACWPSRWSGCRAPRAPRPWTCSARRPAWPATRRC